MTGTFKANNPYNNFLLFIYGLVLKLPSFIHPEVPKPEKWDGFLYKLFISWLHPAGKNFTQLYSIIAFLLIYLQAIAINKLVNDQRLLPKPNYLTGMAYILIASVYPGWNGLHPVLISISFLIPVLSKLCSLHNNPEAKTTLFNIGLISGIAILVYFPTIVFLVMVLAGIAITRTFKLPEWIIVFLGVICPFYFLAAGMFLAGKNLAELTPTFALSNPLMPANPWAYAALVLILFTAAVGLIFVQNNMRRLLVQSRKSWSILLIFLLMSIVIPFLNTQPAFSFWMFTAIPLSALAAAAFLYPDRKWFPIVIHWGLVALTAVMAYFYITK